ncbi:MAG: PrgI family mobile element protein [Moorellaceae bacterium]
MYLIPRNVRARFEFFPGFGWFELAFVLAGALVGFLLYALAGLFTRSFFRIVLFIVPPGLAYFVTRPGPDGQSLYGLIKLWRRWKRSRKRYLYVTKGE